MERHRHPLLLLIGELKDIISRHCGPVAVIKHLPDQRFALPAELHESICNQHQQVAAARHTSDAPHLMVVGTVGLDNAGAADDQAMFDRTSRWTLDSPGSR